MIISLKKLSLGKDLFTAGHSLCPGCAEPLIVRMILMMAPTDVVVANATSCLEVCSSRYPYAAWDVPYIHNAFENTAATLSGVMASYRSMRKRGELSDEIRFIGFGGDGGTYDIGFQSLSGALERRERFLYVCYNNEAYMNTGYQRSSASPQSAWTSTTPVGKVVIGKPEPRKDMTAIVAAHGIPYAAQASISHWSDLMAKARRGLNVDGPAFLNVLAPCPAGWGLPSRLTVEIGRLAVETCHWPLYEVDRGEWRLTYVPKEKRPLREFLRPQKRFSHLFTPEASHLLDEMQRRVDEDWLRLQERCKPAAPLAHLFKAEEVA